MDIPSPTGPGWLGSLTAPVRYSSVISPQAKLVFAEITALIDRTGLAVASNRYLGDLMGITSRRVVICLEELVQAGFLTITYDEETPSIRLLAPALHPVSNDPSVRAELAPGVLDRIREHERFLHSPTSLPSGPKGPSVSSSGSFSQFFSLRESPEGLSLRKKIPERLDERADIPPATPHMRRAQRIVTEWNTLAASCNLEPADPQDVKLIRAVLRRTSDREHPKAAFWRELFKLIRNTTRFHGGGWLSLEWIVRSRDAPLKLKRMSMIWRGQGSAPQNSLHCPDVNEELATRWKQSHPDEDKIDLTARRTADEPTADPVVHHVPGSSGKTLKGWHRPVV